MAWYQTGSMPLPEPMKSTIYGVTRPQCVKSLRPRQNGCHFAENIFKYIFLNDNAWISIKISLKFVPKGPINNIPAFVQIMAWCRPGDKPLSEPMMIRLLTHICVTRPQWVKSWFTHILWKIWISFGTNKGEKSKLYKSEFWFNEYNLQINIQYGQGGKINMNIAIKINL